MVEPLLAFLEYTPLVEIELGPLNMSPHGLGIALGYLLGTLLMMPHANRMGMKEADIYNILTWAAGGAIVGARIAYVINHLGDFDNPLEWFAIWEGGISLLGGITGAVLMAAPKMRAAGYSFWRVMDVAAGPLAAGIIVGRIGDLVVADHLGKTTDFFLGYVCPAADTASSCIAPVGEAVHQPALYDLINLLWLTPFLFWFRHRARYDGQTILMFAFFYGAGRLVEDFFRIDVTHGTGLTGSQWTSVVAMAAALYVLAVRRRTPWASGQGVHRSEPGHPPPAAIAAAFDSPIPQLDADESEPVSPPGTSDETVPVADTGVEGRSDPDAPPADPTP